jgi:hypothetical protein
MSEQLEFQPNGKFFENIFVDGKNIGALKQIPDGRLQVQFYVDGPYIAVPLTILDSIVSEKNRLYGISTTPSSDLTFRDDMDPKSNDIYREDKRIGILSWHDGPGRVLLNSFDNRTINLTISDITYILDRREEIKKLRKA